MCQGRTVKTYGGFSCEPYQKQAKNYFRARIGTNYDSLFSNVSYLPWSDPAYVGFEWPFFIADLALIE